MDVAKLFQDAKDKTLKNGEHQPTLIFELDNNDLIVGIINNLPGSTQAKMVSTFVIGREFGKEYPSASLKSLALISEMWCSVRRSEEELISLRPSQDPGRIERLGIIAIAIKPNEEGVEHSGFFCDMLRDRRGNLVDLGPTSEFGNVIRNPLLLTAFAGFQSRSKSDEEIEAMAKGGKQ